MAKTWIFIGTILGGTGVILGAFGAHALRERLSERAQQIYQTASHYQFIHAIALVLLGLWWLSIPASSRSADTLALVSGWLFAAGTLIFSGSLYALAVSGIKILGAITPIGGLSLIAGWAFFAASVWKAGL